jgi:excinuclease ABC subunit A
MKAGKSGGRPDAAEGALPHEFVRVRGAREHNLKNVDVDIPRDALVVLPGVSGSGKSSLAFGTLYAEAQRRYLESVAPLCAAALSPDGHSSPRFYSRTKVIFNGPTQRGDPESRWWC